MVVEVVAGCVGVTLDLLGHCIDTGVVDFIA
jgi:hypothetical protein